MATNQEDRAFRLEDIEAALARAAENARRLAAAAGQPVIYYENGQIIEEYPGDEQTPQKPVREAG